MDERIRVVVAGPGRGEGDRTAEVLARALRDAGMEVVYTDRPHAPGRLAATVVQEDADAVGVVLPRDGDPAPLAGLAAALTGRGVDDVLPFAVADGTPPGVARVFPRDTDPGDVAGWVRAGLSG
ncbi:methylmalonyl-CoA mutase [Blastococcus sp. TF02-09]|uniref:methylmalonyl-CoA mutase n=1 Tax=Blastococcus sp. TF02-09 TaxID=2250576 RepID=UPI000DE96003|nr:methylmalonyl-CoA mutase [Blastococcus sp. TF02-9]RBY80120.1 methylmalonyl-CoA mutase [Blastococcus sp. TF02-9]